MWTSLKRKTFFNHLLGDEPVFISSVPVTEEHCTLFSTHIVDYLQYLQYMTVLYHFYKDNYLYSNTASSSFLEKTNDFLKRLTQILPSRYHIEEYTGKLSQDTLTAYEFHRTAWIDYYHEPTQIRSVQKLVTALSQPFFNPSLEQLVDVPSIFTFCLAYINATTDYIEHSALTDDKYYTNIYLPIYSGISGRDTSNYIYQPLYLTSTYDAKSLEKCNAQHSLTRLLTRSTLSEYTVSQLLSLYQTLQYDTIYHPHRVKKSKLYKDMLVTVPYLLEKHKVQPTDTCKELYTYIDTEQHPMHAALYADIGTLPASDAIRARTQRDMLPASLVTYLTYSKEALEDTTDIEEEDIDTQDLSDEEVMNSTYTFLKIQEDTGVKEYIYKNILRQRLAAIVKNPPKRLTKGQIILIQAWLTYWINLVSIKTTQHFIKQVLGVVI